MTALTNNDLGNAMLIEPKDLIDLPEELIKQLSFGNTEKQYYEVISALQKFGGSACLDKLLIALFKQTGRVTKRTDLTALLYRMNKKGLIVSVKGKKGIYSLTNPNQR